MNTIETILFGIFCFIGGGMIGIMISCILQISHEADSYQYKDKELENNEQETRPIIKE